MTNVASKEILARLLANENLTVTHERVPTASFNVRDRILTLPQWDDMANDTYDHFVGHEVGHALYTPEDGWHESASSKGDTYRSFLNVVEDARIEKMIQTRYPGLRRSFISSYKRLLADGFFGADIERINQYGLIDRLNTYFKCGSMAGVRIEKSEMTWVKQIEKLQTWEDVVELTDRLYEFLMGEQAERDQEIENILSNEPEIQEDEDEDMEDFGDVDADDEDEDEGDSDGKGNTNSDEDGDETDEEGEGAGAPDGDEDEGDDSDTTSESESQSDSGAGESGDSMLSSKTDSSLRKQIENHFGDRSDIAYANVTLNNNPVDGLIVGYKEIYDEYLYLTDSGDNALEEEKHQASENRRGREKGKRMYKKFLVNNKKSINYMVKEFEMKKSASAYSRQSVSKTGVIDPLKMNSYKFSDDIFRKVTTTQDGQSHGMIMYVDWSGSMCGDLKNTVEQLLNLVHFCRQVNIPFRVFAFSDRGDSVSYINKQAADKVADDTTLYTDCFRLLEFFSSDMKKNDFVRASEWMLAIAESVSYGYWGRGWSAPRCLQLGGTPLDDAIIAAIKVHESFQKKYRVDIVNTIFLTDGDSHSANSKSKTGGYNSISSLFDSKGDWRVLHLNDPVTKKRYRCVGYRGQQTATLLKMYRERTGSTTIGYRIVPTQLRKFQSELPSSITYYESIDLHTELKKEKFVILPACLGYDKAYAIAGGKNLETSNGAIEVEGGESKAKIRTAFKKANNARKGSRKLLSDLIDTVA
jgi:hypothetical protein